MEGLTFNNIHCSVFGLCIADNGTKRPLLAENKDTYVEVPFSSGSYLIPDSSKKDITVEVTFILKPPEDKTLFDACRDISVWLSPVHRTRLIFDDDPNYAYVGKPIGSISFEDIVKMAGEFTVQFRCLPDMVAVGT